MSNLIHDHWDKQPGQKRQNKQNREKSDKHRGKMVFNYLLCQVYQWVN